GGKWKGVVAGRKSIHRAFSSATSPPTVAMDAQKQLQALSDEFQQLQTELEGLVDARQKLESQQQENQGVQSEFAQLDDESNIYKLVGPVLLKQDKAEATMAVNGRLEFIEKEIKRIEGEITDKEEKGEKKRAEVLQIQAQAQAQQQQATAASA
ncbi:hypothetical protein N7533_006814, partial [Penicillium manginii]|uniref:uncharacterized protein n=1 Tax=Penicillium manginii TaxID=203109 RepID=UPI002548973F